MARRFDDVIEKVKLPSGGGVTKAIEELELSRFHTETHALDKKSKGSLLRLTDEFSVFYWQVCRRASNQSSHLGRSVAKKR